MTEEITLCALAVAGKDIGGYRLEADRLAVSPAGTLLVAQVAAPAALVKGFAGVLHNHGQLAEITLAAGTLKNDEYPYGRTVHYLGRASEGYVRAGVAHLGYGVAHALFVARAPGLLRDCTEDALWRELCGPRYTTPLLRPWVPHLMAKLRAAGLLISCLGHRTTAGLLTATQDDLDRLVTEGLQAGRLRLEEGRAA
jgi:hypothetical protein